jgi:hypothetical protein
VVEHLGGRRRRGPENAVIVSFDGPANAFRALAASMARGLMDEVGVGVAIDDVSRDASDHRRRGAGDDTPQRDC